jgi:hypothetical protein
MQACVRAVVVLLLRAPLLLVQQAQVKDGPQLFQKECNALQPAYNNPRSCACPLPFLPLLPSQQHVTEHTSIIVKYLVCQFAPIIIEQKK